MRRFVLLRRCSRARPPPDRPRPRNQAACCGFTRRTARPACRSMRKPADRRPARDGRVQQPGDVRPACRGTPWHRHRPRPRRPSWAWSADGKDLTFKLRHGVKWHDGQPFSAADVVCTWNMLLGKSDQKFRANPRKSWWWNLDHVAANGDDEVTFTVKEPQPALLALLASGWSPVYPCHEASRPRCGGDPIGTGPFKSGRVQAGRIRIRLVRNPDYWKPGHPYLDGIVFIDHPQHVDGAPRLCRRAIRYDRLDPLSADGSADEGAQIADAERPNALCEVAPVNSSVNLIVNRDAPPFDNPEMRRAMALSLDRQAFIDILSRRAREPSAARCRRRRRFQGMPGIPEEVTWKTVEGHDPDVVKNTRGGEAREIMRDARLRPDKRLAIKVSTRNLGPFKDPAVILIDQLKEIWIDAELDAIETASWFPKIVRKIKHGRAQPDRQRRRRSRPAILRELRLRLGTQLHRLLQSGHIEKLFGEQSQMEADQGTHAASWSGRSNKKLLRRSASADRLPLAGRDLVGGPRSRASRIPSTAPPMAGAGGCSPDR